jgi:hypothetical protein
MLLKIHPRCAVCLIEPFITRDTEVNIDKILRSADSIESAPKYHIDKIM